MHARWRVPGGIDTSPSSSDSPLTTNTSPALRSTMGVAAYYLRANREGRSEQAVAR